LCIAGLGALALAIPWKVEMAWVGWPPEDRANPRPRPNSPVIDWSTEPPPPPMARAPRKRKPEGAFECNLCSEKFRAAQARKPVLLIFNFLFFDKDFACIPLI